ncbi:MAG: DNA polymerase III subunit gamma/tau, partial [Muribaculaceae bacterium]|nr:DNA polymerase III subunit gamma/tau [Muribaculaceae bacterium]
METYLVSARKYRPSTFASVVGQKNLAATLKNSISTGRLAHAYLFCGSRGVGKTSCARIFAKTINCEHPTADGEACNECESCRSFNEGRSMNIIELDAASNNSVDDIRALVDQVQVPPTNGRYRVFIVDEVHMLSSGAFNAFLKTLEEPPAYVIFILATTEKHKIIPTILSRCQIYDFNRITIQDMIDHMSYVASCEGITAEPEALGVIARKADGAMRDALSIFDQVSASSGGHITYKATIDNLNVLDADYYSRLLDAFLSGDVPQALLIYQDIRDHGFDSHFFITGLADYFRDLMVAREESTMKLLQTSDDQREAMHRQSLRCTPQFLFRAMDLCNDADLNYRLASNKQFLVELTLIKLCQAESPSRSNDSGSGDGQLQKIEPATASTQPQNPVTPKPAAPHTVPTPAPQQQPKPVQPKVAVNMPPAPKAPSTTAKAAPRTILGPNISINANRMEAAANDNTSSPASATVSATSQLRTNNYNDALVEAAWQSYITRHPQAHLLIHTMQASHPARIEANRYVIKLESQAQYDVISGAMPDLMTHMRNSIVNDLFTIELV